MKIKKRIFLDLVTTNLTRFFRNSLHFQTFEKFVIPNLINIKNIEEKIELLSGLQDAQPEKNLIH